MNDLISRENAKDYFCEHCDIRVLAQINVDVCREKSGCIFMRQLDKIKTIDAVPVVRCKDCIRAREDYPGEFYCEITDYEYWKEADGYCSNGRKREQNDEP